MPEFPLEREAEKAEIELQVLVYFHAEVGDDLDIHAGELGDRTQAIRHAVESALHQEDETLNEWAYREVRLGNRKITRFGRLPVTIDAASRRA